MKPVDARRAVRAQVLDGVQMGEAHVQARTRSSIVLPRPSGPWAILILANQISAFADLG